MKLMSLDDRWLLRGLIIGEADSEPFLGKLAVACVVRNRVDDTRWSDTYKAVILRDSQFSCFNGIPRDEDLPTFFVHRYFTSYRDYLWWRECDYAAWGVLSNYVGDVTHGGNHYYNPSLVDDDPSYYDGYDPVCIIENHHFYKL